MTTTPQAVLDYWFKELDRSVWFNATAKLDAQIRHRFEHTYQQALAGELTGWQQNAQGCLALIIVLDQFPLNMYRNMAIAFEGEQAARDIAAHAISRGFDAQLDGAQKAFLYMPYMHSEDLADQDRAIALFERAGLADNAKWARHHREIVRRFGRFPHRNALLGRPSSAAEEAWLQSEEAFRG